MYNKERSRDYILGKTSIY